jgi:hypothetical protein
VQERVAGHDDQIEAAVQRERTHIALNERNRCTGG